MNILSVILNISKCPIVPRWLTQILSNDIRNNINSKNTLYGCQFRVFCLASGLSQFLKDSKWISFKSIITDTREWRYFKQLYSVDGPIEEGMFNKEAQSHHVEIFLRPKETVHIPFKYQCFTADESVKPQVVVVN